MTNMTPDPRTHAYRADLADIALEGQVDASEFVSGQKYHIAAPSTYLRKEPGDDYPIVTQALCGENVDIFEIRGEWAWGQLCRDKYVGYVLLADLAKAYGQPVCKVLVKHSHIYQKPDIKTRPDRVHYFGARLAGAPHDDRFFKLDDGNFIIRSHLGPLDQCVEDFVCVAENYTGAPYLWGGKASFGLDCSALVQISLQAAGIDAPRDSDMQEKSLGTALMEEAWAQMQRGDLVFWQGHVGIMTNEEILLHASGHHMLVVQESFQQARRRIADEYGDITSIKRL